MKNEQKEAGKLAQSFAKGSSGRLLMGVGSGWITGMISVRVGRVPVALLGTSIIIFQAAQNQGMVDKTWSDVFKKASNVKEENNSVTEKTKSFMNQNPAFAAGFAGGFLIGLAC